MLKQFVVKSVETKSGISNGKEWKFYIVNSDEGAKYQTNNPEWLNKVGQAMQVEIEQRPSKKLDMNGQPYINLVIVEPKQYQPKGGDIILAELKRIGEKVDEIHKMVSDLAVEPVPPDGGPEVGDAQPEDNPFA